VKNLLLSIFISFLLSSCLDNGKEINLSGLDLGASAEGRFGQQLPLPEVPGNSDESDEDLPNRQDPSDEEDNCDELEYDIDALLDRISLLEQKKEDWDEIIVEGLETFKKVEPIFEKKCFACHNSDDKIPWYGRILPRRNPVNHHYYDGIEALDFSRKFPLASKGSSDQIALLNGIKNSVLDLTMPLKIYTKFYPKRKITPQDKIAIKYWAMPLIEKIQAWEEKYIYELEEVSLFKKIKCNEDTGEQSAEEAELQIARKKVTRVFSAKCFRCHANGVSKGGFGGMHDLENLAKSKYVDLETPDFSEIYMITESGDMPTSSRDRLTADELQTILRWIQAEADIIK
tara:strand:+ start:118 stop:1149 length:1032 start_codon:yes stop_codon:yes gene_type:complete